jgi:hypothetical protein
MLFDGPSQVRCYKCGGETKLAEQVSRLGQAPGFRVFSCVTCNELTWTPITPPMRAPTTPIPMSEPEK